RSTLTLETMSNPAPLPATNTLCGGCKLSVETDSNGIVVAFGDSLWHVDCFKCAKCGDRVNADTNLLLLSDGSPVCGGCSYHCSICKLPITDEAIMTGDDSYHALCFTCRQCGKRIEELVFAKTSQGIYCMECHNERAARSRRHHEKKKRAKAKLEEEQKRDVSGPVCPFSYPNNTSSATDGPSTLSTSHGTSKANGQTTNHPQRSNTSPHTSNDGGRMRSNSRSFTTPAVNLGEPLNPPPQRGSSMEDSGLEAANGGPSSLNVPSNRSNKRRSINPGLRLAESESHPLNQVLPGSPVTMDLYSPALSAESAVPSPGLVTTGNVVAQVSPQTLPNGAQEITLPRENGRGRSNSGYINYDTPPASARSGRSRSNTPVPSNVDANGRTSDESDSESGPTLPPKLGFNGAVDQTSSKSSELPPIEVSFQEDPDFTNLLTSFGDDSSTPKLTLKDPAGSRRSMQALVNVATMLGEESVNSNGPISKTYSNHDGMASSLPSEDTTLGSETASQSSLTRVSIEAPTISADDSHTPRNSSDSRKQYSPTSRISPQGRPRLGSNASNASGPIRPYYQRPDTTELVASRLKEALRDASDRAATAVKLDRDFVEAILRALQGNQNRYADLKGRLDGMKRVSQRMFDGLSVAQEEYDQEVASRRDAEAEITRLRLQLSTQSAQMAILTADNRKREGMEQLTKDMSDSLQGLEQELSKYKAERDLLLAEMEELASTKHTGEATNLTRSLTSRFDNIKSKYRSDIEPLISKRQALQREIQELKQAKELCLEETTSLTSRNDELLELNMAMTRQLENLQASLKSKSSDRKVSKPTPLPPVSSSNNAMAAMGTNSSLGSVASATVVNDEREDARYIKGAKSDSEASGGNTLRKFPWFKGKDVNTALKDMQYVLSKPQPAPPPMEKPKIIVRHNFQQQSVLRFARCDHCGDKMWGTQLRCANCSTACHTRCIGLLNSPCRETSGNEEKDIVEIMALPPSMFGRDLIEQVHADAKGTERSIPVIVEMCIQAVEVRGMEYEGIYRKTGGAGQTKAITQAFERGQYDAIDLTDPDIFNDISSVTSVLKNYFRSLPNPLLTFELHEALVQAASYREGATKDSALANLVEQLPHEHFETVRLLMLHLHGVMEKSHINLMSARNLGVVFGPTLMRSPDSAKEFADMAGKALCIEWLIENATTWAQKNR
ncbi:RhoGAP-domain-containing protein, partial [Serendipita vermifera]